MTTITLKNEHGDDFCTVESSTINWFSEADDATRQNPERHIVTTTDQQDIRLDRIYIVRKDTYELLGWTWRQNIIWLKFPPRRNLILQIPSLHQENHPMWPATRLLYQSWVQQINTDASDQMIAALWEAFITVEEAVRYEIGYLPFSVAMQILSDFRTVLFFEMLPWDVAQQCVATMRRNLLSDNWKQTERRATIPQTNSTRILRGWENREHPEHFVSVQQVLALRHLARMASEQRMSIGIYPA